MTKRENQRLRKSIELIKWLLLEIEQKNNLRAIYNRRSTFYHIFFNGNRLDELFLYVFPVDELESIDNTLHVLKNAYATASVGDIQEISYGNGGRIEKCKLIYELKKILKYLEQAVAEHGFNIFYSWQSDLSNSTNRSFIEKSLEKAINEVNNEQASLLKLDKDTIDRNGSPDIAQTIFEKIEDSFMFVADISIISKATDVNKKVSNPNVLLELGYAQGVLGADNIIMIFNSATGNLNDLPFDLRGKRIMQYYCDESMDNIKKKRAKEDLIKNLKRAIASRVKSEIR